MMAILRCPTCRAFDAIESAPVPIERTFGTIRLRAWLEARRCSRCEEEVFSVAEVARFERRAAVELLRLEAHSGAALRFVRMAAGLAAASLAEALDVPAERVAAWERGVGPDEEAWRRITRLVAPLLGPWVARASSAEERPRDLLPG